MELLDNTLIYDLSRKLLLQITSSSLLVGGPGSASTKVRFFKHLKFLLQPNKKLLSGKDHGTGWLRNSAYTQNRAFLATFNP